MRITGRIININSSIYTIDANDKIYSCVPRGIFRNKKITPLVGDFVVIDDETLSIEEINNRKNYLERPNIANVDYALIMVSVKKPDLDLVLLDKILVNVITSSIKPIICFSKLDLLPSLDEITKLYNYYESIGIPCITNSEISKFEQIVSGKVLVTTGQTGSGKSTFINKLDSNLKLETNPISDSLGRGVHTTRLVSLYKIKDYYIADTPGFSSLDLSNLDDEIIKNSFLEFENYECKYRDCNHINTDGCSIENNPFILPSRIENYKKFIKEKHEGSRKLF